MLSEILFFFFSGLPGPQLLWTWLLCVWNMYLQVKIPYFLTCEWKYFFSFFNIFVSFFCYICNICVTGKDGEGPIATKWMMMKNR